MLSKSDALLYHVILFLCSQCELMPVPQSSGWYRSLRDDCQVQERLRELTREHPRFGYWCLHVYLHKEMEVSYAKVWCVELVLIG